jgi:ribosome-associated translation inhibitor RaiA
MFLRWRELEGTVHISCRNRHLRAKSPHQKCYEKVSTAISVLASSERRIQARQKRSENSSFNRLKAGCL